MSTFKTTKGMRTFQIGFGIIILILSILVIFNPLHGFLSFVWILGLLLLITGVETIISHVYKPTKSRFTGISLGVAIIVIAIIAVAFPLLASIVVISLLAIALLFSGISRIIHGIDEKHNKNWKWGFIMISGILSIGLSVLILIFPVFGIAIAGLLIGISLLVAGTQMISSGLSGRVKDIR